MDELMPVVDRIKDWNASVILVSSVITTILFIISRIIYPDFYKMVTYRMFVENFSGRQVTKPTEISSIEALSTIIALIAISTMIFSFICYSGVTTIKLAYGSELKTILIILLSFSAYNFSRGLINLYSGKLFKLDKYAAIYNTMILDTERVLSLIFVPISAFCPFVSPAIANILIWIAVGAGISLMIFQYVTIFFHLLKNKFLNHHSFLYFCALEVLPPLAVIKIMF